MSAIEAGLTRRYRFGPLEKRGVVGGWRGGQLLCVGSSLIVALFALRADSRAPGVLAALAAIVVGIFSSTWPIQGMTVEQWTPVVLRWALYGARARVSARPAEGHSVVGKAIVAPAQELPCGLGGISIVQMPSPGGGQFGVVYDEREACCAAVLAVSGEGFALLEPSERDRRVASWSALLASMARDRCPVDRIQWITRTLPESGEEITSRFQEGCRLPRDSAAAISYTHLLEDESLDFVRHETFVVVRISLRRLRNAVSGSRRHTFLSAAGESLMQEVVALVRELHHAGIKVEGVLDPASLQYAIAEPFRLGALSEGLPLGGAWPLSSRAEWHQYATDDSFHAVYWVAEWPRVDVRADFLSPLLFLSTCRVTVSVCMAPVDTPSATRKVESARVSRAADDELRRRGGFMSTARRRREDDALSVREVELADGHAHFRFSGYVGVTASTSEELESACAAVEQAASRSFLALRRLYGDQARAFGCLLPLGRGLR